VAANSLIPLWIFFFPVLAVATAAYIYRRAFPYDLVKEAIEIANEYRNLERSAKDKRTQRRLRSLRPKYLKARRVLRAAILTKFVLLTAFYIATSTVVIRYPLSFPAPAWIPFLTLNVKDELVINPLLLHLLGYLYALIAFRDALL
jgi:hypothetical protein